MVRATWRVAMRPRTASSVAIAITNANTHVNERAHITPVSPATCGHAPGAQGLLLVRPELQRAPRIIPLPHPSPRNIAWFKANPWFEDELVPVLRRRVRKLVGGGGATKPRCNCTG